MPYVVGGSQWKSVEVSGVIGSQWESVGFIEIQWESIVDSTREVTTGAG